MRLLLVLAVVLLPCVLSKKCCLKKKFTATALDDDGDKVTLVVDYGQGTVYRKTVASSLTLFDIRYENDGEHVESNTMKNNKCKRRDILYKSEVHLKCVPENAQKKKNPKQWKNDMTVKTYHYALDDDVSVDFTFDKNCVPLHSVIYNKNFAEGAEEKSLTYQTYKAGADDSLTNIDKTKCKDLRSQ